MVLVTAARLQRGEIDDAVAENPHVADAAAVERSADHRAAGDVDGLIALEFVAVRPQVVEAGAEVRHAGVVRLRRTFLKGDGREKVIVSSGRRITGWRRGDGECWVADVAGVKEGRWYARQLFGDGGRAVRARTPNKDADPPCWQLKGAALSKDLKQHTFQFASGQLKAWRNLGDVEAVVCGPWEITRKRFQDVDPATGVARMAGPHAVPHEAIALGEGRWFCLENAAEMLDQPGEWYLDRSTGCGIEVANRCRNIVIQGNRITDISGNGIQVGGPRIA